MSVVSPIHYALLLSVAATLVAPRVATAEPPQTGWSQPPVQTTGSVLPPADRYFIARAQSSDDGWLYPNTPVERGINDVFRHAFFRMEYLLWDIRRPRRETLGANTSNIDSARTVLGTDQLNLNSETGLAPSTEQFRNGNNNGIRATLGLLWDNGSWETSVWALESSTSHFLPSSTLVQDTNVANTRFVNFGILQPVLLNGADSGRAIIYNDVDTSPALAIDPTTGQFLDGNAPNYRATLKTSVWGAESNWVVDAADPNVNASIRPMLGLKFLQFDEDLRQSGEYFPVDSLGLPRTLATDAVTRNINARTNNHYFGPQIGLRAEVQNKWFTLGLEPKWLIGVNTYKATLTTSRIFSPNNTTPGSEDFTPEFQYEPDQSTSFTKTTFGPVFDLRLYTQVKVNEHFRLLASYEFQWMAFLARPTRGIIYDSRDPNFASDESVAAPQFRLNPKYDTNYIHGLTVGGEFTW